MLAGRPAILYKSLPSLILPAGDSGEHGGRQPAVAPVVAGAAEGIAVIPLKETLARRLSASMDCIDVAGNDGEKLADDATAANTTTSESQLAVDVDEPQTERP